MKQRSSHLTETDPFGKGNDMAVRVSGDICEIEKGLENVFACYPYAGNGRDEQIIVSRMNEAEEKSLHVYYVGQELHIDYKRPCDFFRALGHVLEQQGEQGDISEQAAYEKSGVMLDISRDAVYTMSQIKEFLVWLSLCGLNTCYLYMEDMYELKGYPYFGYLRGAYSQEELKELDDFADTLGIELIPCVQTLAHLATTLKWDYAAEMKDTVNTLMVGKEETYQFIHEMLRQLGETFRTRRIHIGMDEAMDLGTGAYLRKQSFKPQFDLMLEHLNRVTDMAEELGLTPIIWDDMFYRSKNENLEYYDPKVVLTDEDISRIPPNVQLAYWDYYHNTQDEYECMLEKRNAFKQHIIFTGGIWKWNGFVPNYGKTFTTTHAALQACKHNHVDEILAAMWGDNGAETVLQTVWPGLILWGQYAYDAAVDDETINRRCIAFTGLSLEGYKTIEELDLPPGCERPNTKTRNPSKYLLYQDLLIGAFDIYFKDEKIAGHYKRAAEELCRLAENGNYPPAFTGMLEMYACLADVLSIKSSFGQSVREAYRKKDMDAIQKLAGGLDVLSEKVNRLHRAFVHTWCYGTKGTGLEVHDIRLGGLQGRIQTVQTRLLMFVHGELERLDELEQEILPFMQMSLGDEVYPLCNKYHLIVTQNLI